MKNWFILLAALTLAGCSTDGGASQTNQSLYFPPVGSDVWETKTPESLNWHTGNLQALYDYLSDEHTKSFIVLVDGKIVVEQYFNGQTAAGNWYWASAGKTLTSTMTGIAQQEGLLDIDDKVSDYIGTGWTSAPIAKENLITNRHLLTMTSGLDDSLGDSVEPDSLQYLADAGSRWAYHNVYVKLQDVISAAAGTDFKDFFNARLRDPIGMNGVWLQSGNNSVYYSTARSMARFGLLMLNKGKWENTVILNPDYFHDATNTSQTINHGYGYLWWLNGKDSYHLPQSQFQFSGSIIPTAPDDMFMALGKNDQKIYIIPSRRMVVVRMGDSAGDPNPALSDFDETLWVKISAVIGN
jgi:CubicO group peptidase (beta-lactamase class C family)